MENRIMRRRGRPCKGSEDKSPIRKTKTLRLTDAETKLVSDNAKKCKMNFSEYCRKVLLNYQPVVPDPKFRDELFAVRKDITNFINFIQGLKMDQQERKRFLAQMPTLQTWWKSLFSEIEFIDKQMRRM